ncbi:hypothetical protein [Citricoccus nitrophenolicus]|uniref:hypothetical protein n=1 Tax=Citricoccus nitrophenolicus TaxID=863575 RepID=UPI0036116E13
MAQPYKGKRDLVSGRIPASYAPKLEAFIAKSTKYKYKSDLVAELLVAFLDQNDPDQAEGQETIEFEFKKAS